MLLHTAAKTKKITGPGYVKDLEKSVQRFKSILLQVFPDCDIDDPLF